VYHFAIVALLGLAVYKAVDFLFELVRVERPAAVRTFVALGAGVLATEVLDYSLFAGWGVSVRSAWMGPFFTGLIVGGASYVWRETLGLLEGYGRRSRDEAMEIERRTPRAA
jgi:hypothetical protein